MNRDDALKHKKKKSHKLGIILWLSIFAFVAVLIMYLYALGGANLGEILAKRNYWLSNGVADGLLIIAYLMMYRIDAQNIALNENELEDTEWLTPKKLRKLHEFTVTSWKHQQEHNDEIVIGAEQDGRDVEIISTSQLHALIVGTTGSGKTTGFVDQNISILAKSKTKPSLVISDPKKELYEKHAKTLESQGYNINVLDLRDAFASQHWNPMSVLIRRIKLVKELEAHCDWNDGKYEGIGEIFLTYSDARARRQELLDEIYENAQDFVYTLCPVQNKDQPTWEEGARNLILGLVLAFCEDCIAGKMDESQMMLFNVYHNITKYCSEDTTVLKDYLLTGRSEFSKVRGLVNTVLITSDKTLTSYLSEVNAYMNQLADDGLLSLTSKDDLDIVNMDENPNAMFIIIPDERFTRHRFVTLFITQMYKELVEKANLNLRRGAKDTAILKRNTYFILDEFGNLPKFENIEGMVTVARSRGIRFLFVLQSFSQLTAKYGRDIADIIKSNCNVKIFIGSDDPDTRKEFSELCGQKKIKNFSVNTASESQASSNTGATNQPLITIGMLERLNGDEKGDAIVSVRGYEPIWTKFTPSFKLKSIYFREGKADMTRRDGEVLNKQKVVFDILKQKGEDTEDKAMEYIVQKESVDEEKILEDERQRVSDLTLKWKEIRKMIDEQLAILVKNLRGMDRRAVLEAKLENKPTVLYELMDNYSMNMADKMQKTADFIRSKSNEMFDLQEARNNMGGK